MPPTSCKCESYSCAAACAYLLSLAIAPLVFQFGPANGLLCLSHACHATTRRQTVTSAVTWGQLISCHVVRKRIIGDQLPLINGILNAQRAAPSAPIWVIRLIRTICRLQLQKPLTGDINAGAGASDRSIQRLIWFTCANWCISSICLQWEKKNCKVR